MTDKQIAGDLLAEAAQKSVDIDAVIETDGDEFEIHMADGVVIAAEFDPEFVRVMLSAEIGTPPAERERTAFSTLLLYNSLWRETGGVRAALSGIDEPVFLMVDFFMPGLDADQVAALITNFKQKVDVWTTYVTAKDEPDTVAMPNDEFSFIRA